MPEIETCDRTITVKGKIFHNDGRKRIDLKKPIRDLFEEANENIGYAMEVCLSENKLLNRIKELSGKNIRPVILYFTVEVEDEELMS